MTCFEKNFINLPLYFAKGKNSKNDSFVLDDSFVITVILLYLVLMAGKRKKIILQDISASLDGQLIELNGDVVRFLGVNSQYVFFERFDGQVIEKKIRDIKTVRRPSKTLFFTFGKVLDVECLSVIVQKNPYIPAEAVALCEGITLGTGEKHFQVCIKDIRDFRLIKQFIKYIQSHL